MSNNEIIKKTEEYVKKTLGTDAAGHDWFHVHRVYKNALVIARTEKEADLFIVKLAALLHDIADWKFHDSDKKGGIVTQKWLSRFKIDTETIKKVVEIIDTLSFKGGTNSPMQSIEGKIVQDADRLDALGAIGIARAFAYGGFKGREIYNPSKKPLTIKSFNQYKNNKGPTVNHFYEKLLLLRDKMNTKEGRKIAAKRHKFLEVFLKEFYKEWGK